MEFSYEFAEMLPEREALGGWWGGGDVNTIVADNTAVALFGSQATAAQVITQVDGGGRW
ncbi:hypothetical protein AB0L13_08875 [Saccharopolyspora shandongensis]|uniref:hypothetical protein n=1 Tax=Saccharopolyspora shandongensis TaxID=418495 RepID=UPI003414F636